MTDTTANLVLEFDDLMSCTRVLWENSYAEDFLKYVIRQETVLAKYEELQHECKRLKDALDESVRGTSILDSKLKKARQLLDIEKKQVTKLENERDAMASVLEEVRRILCNDSRCKLPEDTKNRLTVITSNNAYGKTLDRFSSQTDLESSDISITRSEDDLDDSRPVNRNKRRLTCVNEEPYAMPKKKSSIYPPLAPLASQPESLESTESERDVIIESKNGQFRVLDRLNARTHRFENCSLKLGAECLSCGKKIRLRAAFKCAVCNTFSHPECRSSVPLPCVPLGIPAKPGVIGSISDYAPPATPLIPAVVSHCIYEVERRGLQEKGIYRVSGDHKEVHELKEKFIKYKLVPNLSKTEINTVCSFLKEFLRSLNEPLIPKSKWACFAQSISDTDKDNKLREVVSTLPRANRDTLAFLILHLQKVSQSPACHMDIYNLATVFGPTIVGYCDPTNPLGETAIGNNVMEQLLSIDAEYWSQFLEDPMPPPPTPASDITSASKESSKKTPRKYFSRW